MLLAQAETTSTAMDILPITEAVSSVPNDGLNGTIAGIERSVQQLGGAPSLPSFGAKDIDPEKLAPWKQWLKDAWDAFWKKFGPDMNTGENTVYFFQYLGYALMLAVVVLLCWAAYRWIKRQELPQYGRHRAPRRMAEDSRLYLENALDEALAQKRYALAARLRWRLFLQRTGKPAGATQAEVLSRKGGAVPPSETATATRAVPPPQRPEVPPLLNPATSNALMFSEVAQAEQLVRSWDHQLEQEEKLPQEIPDSTEAGAIKEAVLLLGLAIGLIVILAFNLFSQRRQAQERSVADGNGAYQIRPVLENRAQGSTQNLDMPVLDRDNLGPDKNGTSIVLMLSPRMSLSRREANILNTRITEGLHLVMSFHDAISMEAVSETLMMINPQFVPKIDRNEKFINQKTKVIESAVDMAWLRKGERYAFYAPLTMNDMKCDLEEIFCYAREFEMGKGNVTVFAGLFPASSALVLQADNKLLAARLIQDPRPLMVDQYHLLQSDRGIRELLGEAFFWVPLLIMVVGLIVYMIFGQETLTSRGFGLLRADRPNYLKRRPHQPESYHQFSRRMLVQALKRPAAATEAPQLQGEWLARLMATRTGTAPEQLRLSTVELTQKHIEWLKHNFLWKVSRKESSNDHSPSL